MRPVRDPLLTVGRDASEIRLGPAGTFVLPGVNIKSIMTPRPRPETRCWAMGRMPEGTGASPAPYVQGPRLTTEVKLHDS